MQAAARVCKGLYCKVKNQEAVIRKMLAPKSENQPVEKVCDFVTHPRVENPAPKSRKTGNWDGHPNPKTQKCILIQYSGPLPHARP